jgi:hypothetical protein
MSSIGMLESNMREGLTSGGLDLHEAEADLVSIYGDLTTQIPYTVESRTRVAIQRAYGDA